MNVNCGFFLTFFTFFGHRQRRPTERMRRAKAVSEIDNKTIFDFNIKHNQEIKITKPKQNSSIPL